MDSQLTSTLEGIRAQSLRIAGEQRRRREFNRRISPDSRPQDNGLGLPTSFSSPVTTPASTPAPASASSSVGYIVTAIGQFFRRWIS